MLYTWLGKYHDKRGGIGCWPRGPRGPRGPGHLSILIFSDRGPLLVAKTLSFPLKGGNARLKSGKKRVKRKAAMKGICKYFNGICRCLSDFKIGFQEFAQ